MSLPLLPTLEEVRNAVAKRTRSARNGTLPAPTQDWVDEEIRRAQREMFARFHWLRRDVSIRITLSAGVSVYDIPNVLNLNGIQRVGLLETDGKRVRQLMYDDLADITNGYPDPGTPRFWKIMGAQVAASPSTPPPVSAGLVLAPAPTSQWTTLVVEGQMRDYPPEADDDRIVVDGEAVTQLVTIRYKEFTGLGGSQAQNRQDLSDYIQGLRGLEAPSRMYTIASRRADGPAYWDFPSTAAGYAPYSPQWNPW